MSPKSSFKLRSYLLLLNFNVDFSTAINKKNSDLMTTFKKNPNHFY